MKLLIDKFIYPTWKKGLDSNKVPLTCLGDL